MRADPDDVEARLAAQLVRRKCRQHLCGGEGCTDPNHRRDEHRTQDHLQMLGLSETLPAVGHEERHAWFDTYAQKPTRGASSGDAR